MVKRSTAVVCVLCVMTAACGQLRMVKTSRQIRDHVMAQDYRTALAILRANKNRGFKEQDRVVYWMNEGALLHLVGEYRSSSQVFDKAERRSEELFTKSIRKNIRAAFTSQAATDYAGEDYEKVLLNVFKAFNYLRLGDTESALVEARKINEKLTYFNTKYERANVYNQDAFAYWLAGILFEIEHSYDDARIAFKKALDIYNDDFSKNYGMAAPAYVAEDLTRVAALNGDTDLVQQFREAYGTTGNTATLLKTHGEIIVVHLNGEGPTKSDLFVTCWFRDKTDWACDAEPGGDFVTRRRIDIPEDGTVVKVGLPELHVYEPAVPFIEVHAGEATGQSLPAYPLNEIAQKTLADKMHRVFKNAIIRVIVKVISQKAAEGVGKKAGGGLGGWLAKTVTSAAMQASEEADKRAWTTLPARIDIARVMVTPGQHVVSVTLPSGRTKEIAKVDVVAGRRVFLTYRSMP